MDVRRDGIKYHYRTLPYLWADITAGEAVLTLKRAFVLDSSLSALTGLTLEE